jgi:hypothetical protein
MGRVNDEGRGTMKKLAFTLAVFFALVFASVAVANNLATDGTGDPYVTEEVDGSYHVEWYAVDPETGPEFCVDMRYNGNGVILCV